jgi:hypothetical protein
MKQKKEKKLRLDKMTIQNLETVLNPDDQKRVKGGEPECTAVPIYCLTTPTTN